MFVHFNQICVNTSYEEDNIFDECNEKIATVLDVLAAIECDEMISDVTGEVITVKDLRRVRGILSGLPIMTRAYKSK